MVIKLTSLAVSALLLVCSPVIFAQETTEDALSPETGDQDTTQPSIVDDIEDKGAFYDGQLELGYGLEIIKQDNFDADDWGQGFIIGKEFYRTDNWSIGVQGHVVSSSSSVNYYDELKFNAYSIFATARHRALPVLQFKVGVVNARYENINTRESGSGLAYGVAIVTGNNKIRLHWLDYEIYKIGDDKFKTGSIGIVLIFCILGACA